MVTKEVIDRINELAHKAKSVGLTPEETEERRVLREQYLESFRQNLKAQLDQIRFVEDLEEDEAKSDVESAEEELEEAISDIRQAEKDLEKSSLIN